MQADVLHRLNHCETNTKYDLINLRVATTVAWHSYPYCKEM